MVTRFGNAGAPGRNVGMVPDTGVDGKLGVGEAGSVETIRERGTAVGLTERRDTEGAGRDGVDEDDDKGEDKGEDEGDEED